MNSTSRSKISNDGSENSMGCIISKSQVVVSLPDALRGRSSKPWSTPPVVLNAFNVDFCAMKALRC
jgi:hypothetical protein